MIRIVCNGGSCQIVDRLPSVPIRDLSNQCSYMVAGFEHMNKGGWDGLIRLFHKRYRTFPIGLLPLVRKILDEHEVTHVVTHAPTNQVSVDLSKFNSDYAPRPYQEDCIDATIKQQIGVIRMATGGGKTVVAGHIMHRLGMPALFLVHTKDLLYQAIEEFSKMFGPKKVGQIGDGTVDIREITVATIQTMTRIFDVEYEKYDEDDNWLDEETDISGGRGELVMNAMDSVGVVFADECHRVAAPTAMSVMERLVNPRFRIGLSASPWRDDGADLAIEACLGPVAYSITASDLIDLGFLVPPIVRILSVPARSYPRGTRYATVHKDYIVENEDRNALIVREAASMVRRQRPCLVLVQRIRHGEALQRAISDRIGTWVPFISGRDNALRRKEILDSVREGRLGIFIASTIADEGLDIKPLAGLILAGGGKSSTKALQRIGRILRPFKDKKDAEVVDFEDNAKWLIQHSAARYRLYDTEPRWEITDF